MTILVCGGRRYADAATVKKVLDEVVGAQTPGSVVLVNGGARGADQLSSAWAKERGIKVIEVPVAENREHQLRIGALWNWEDDGKPAGPRRNQHVLTTYRPDRGVVFPGNDGTLDMLTRLYWAGVPTLVVGR